MGRGDVTVTYSLNCGKCGVGNTSSFARDGVSLRMALTASYIAFVLRRDGWSDTKDDGWICPACKAKKHARK